MMKPWWTNFQWINESKAIRISKKYQFTSYVCTRNIIIKNFNSKIGLQINVSKTKTIEFLDNSTELKWP